MISLSSSSSSVYKRIHLIQLFLRVKNTNGSCRYTLLEDSKYNDDTGELDTERVGDDGEVDTGVLMLGEHESAIPCISFFCFFSYKEVLIIFWHHGVEKTIGHY